MKFLIIVTLLILSVLIFLTSCTTVNERAPLRKGGTAAPARRNSTADPYYQNNADGSYYQSTQEGDNTDYRAGVKRFSTPQAGGQAL
ncbi:MAG: hypothetical protein ABL994_17590 [Verrucomicrobiales bacterium]